MRPAGTVLLLTALSLSGCALVRPNVILSASGYSNVPRVASTVSPQPTPRTCVSAEPIGGDPVPAVSADTMMVTGKPTAWLAKTACALAPVLGGRPRTTKPSQ